jgi:hypothetical protein
MAVVTSYDGSIVINGTDLSDHAKVIRFNTGQESKDATAHGATARTFRAGLRTLSIEATFFNDRASSSVESTLRGLVSITSTGFSVVAQADAASTSTPTSATNPKYSFTGILDGDLSVMDATVGELEEITARFLPYSGTLTVQTTSS